MSQQTVLIVGGAGFLGSSISKAALAKGWRVLSISPSGTPYHTPAGHRPAWSSSPNIEWHAADALDPSSYRHLLDRSTAAVHTVGILLESDYKPKNNQGGPSSGLKNAIAGVVKGWGFGVPGTSRGGNPLEDDKHAELQGKRQGKKRESMNYERMNRDTAIAVAHTFLSSLRERQAVSAPAPFVYISAEDLFRPIVDARYIKTKRQAEAMISRLALQHGRSHKGQSGVEAREKEAMEGEVYLDADGAGLSGELRQESLLNQAPSSTIQDSQEDALLRPIFLRPGLMYHPHTRPGSTLPAAILEASAAFHQSPFLRLPIPTPAQLLSKLGGEKAQPIARLLTTPPLHVDTVAKAVVAAIEDRSVNGPIDVYAIRRLAGWKDEASLKGSTSNVTSSKPFSTQTLHAAARPHPVSPASMHPNGLGQQRSLTTARHAVPRGTPRVPQQQSRSFFNLPDIGKLASSALSSSSSPSPSSGNLDPNSRSYTDAMNRTVYETSRVLPFSHEVLFDVVSDVNSYKEFVPYCQNSRILPSTPNSAVPTSADREVFADLTVGFGKFTETYTSKVSMLKASNTSSSTLPSTSHASAPSTRSSSMVIAEAVQPNPVFSFLCTKWTFTPTRAEEDGKPPGASTKVEFSLTYAFRNPLYGAVAGGVFEKMSSQMIDAFEQRARKVTAAHAR